MSRKKDVKHKGQAKKTSVLNEEIVNSNEKSREERENFLGNKVEKKYQKRTIESNWSKYDTDDLNVDAEDDVNEDKTKNFTYLIQNASSDFTQFEFSEEKKWKKEGNFMSPSNVFNLDLNVLSCGLACIPFYERIDLNPSELSPEEKAYYDEEIKNNLETYDSIKKKFLDKNFASKHCEDNFLVRKHCTESVPDSKVKCDIKSDKNIVMCQKETKSNEDSATGKHPSNNSNKSASDNSNSEVINKNDTNLEEWLDEFLSE